jgi:hypothetical protein
MSWLNKVLTVIGGVVAAAGVIAAAPLGLPAVVVAIAGKVLLYGGTAAIIAAKVLPGHGVNAPAAPDVVPAKP